MQIYSPLYPSHWIIIRHVPDGENSRYYPEPHASTLRSEHMKTSGTFLTEKGKTHNEDTCLVQRDKEPPENEKEKLCVTTFCEFHHNHHALKSHISIFNRLLLPSLELPRWNMLTLVKNIQQLHPHRQTQSKFSPRLIRWHIIAISAPIKLFSPTRPRRHKGLYCRLFRNSSRLCHSSAVPVTPEQTTMTFYATRREISCPR